MKAMKRIFAVLIAAMLMLTVFAGCASSEAEAENGSAVALKIGNTEYTVNDIQYMYISSAATFRSPHTMTGFFLSSSNK